MRHVELAPVDPLAGHREAEEVGHVLLPLHLHTGGLEGQGQDINMGLSLSSWGLEQGL